MPGELTIWEDFRQAIIVRAPLLFRVLPRQPVPGTFGMLMYHRIAPRTSGVPFPTSNVTPPRFRAQLQGLLARGYKPWRLSQALEHHRQNLPIPPKAFVVTFDDGYANNFTAAWPILKELQVPATIFVTTDYLDQDRAFAFEDWSAAGTARVPAEHWRPLTTAECHQMLDSGWIELGSHTHTHRDFRDQPEVFAQDLRQSLEVLRDKFGLTNVLFAFPFGKRAKGFSGSPLVQAAKKVGVQCGLTSENELTRIQDDPFAWGRLTAAEYDTAATLAAKFDGSYGLARDYWNSLRKVLRNPFRGAAATVRS